MSDPLARRIAELQAERLAPVPRASHAVAVDVDDLVVVLDHLRQHGGRALPQVWEALGRLEKTVRSHGRE